MTTTELVVLAVDAALVVIVVEFAVVVARRERVGPGRSFASVVANLAAGAFLMLALRAAVAEAGWAWIVAGLTASGAAHATDWIVCRRRRGEAAP